MEPSTNNAILAGLWSAAWKGLLFAFIWYAISTYIKSRKISKKTADENAITKHIQPLSQATTGMTTASQDAFTNTPANTTSANTSRSNQNQQNGAATSPSSQGQPMENIEDWAYEQVGRELDSNDPDKAAWTKAFAQAGGDDKQTKVLYIKARVGKLIAMEQARLEEICKAQEKASYIAEEGHVKQIAICKNITSEQVAEEINRIDSRVRSDFMSKIAWCELKELVAMMERDPYLVAVSNSEGDTALHIATRTKNGAAIRELAERGANPRATNSAGKTPISIARSKGMEGMAKWMESIST